MDTGTNIKYRYELETWSRLLDYLQEETIHLKNLLSDVIRKDSGSEALEKAEYFQNKFLNKDALLVLFRQELVEQMKNLTSGSPNAELIAQRQHKLKEEVAKLEDQFKKLKTDFSNYIAID